MNNQSQVSDVVVIMAPFPCYSHLNQLLQLSCLISSYSIPVHYACSTIHMNQVKLRFNSMTKLENSQVTFHELSTPPFLSPPPNPNPLNKFPAHLQPSFDSSLHLREPFLQLFHKISLSARRVVVIHDILMSYAVQDIATVQCVESYVFSPISVFASYYGGSRLVNPDAPSDLPKVPIWEGCYTPEMEKLFILQFTSLKSYAGTIINSSRSIEDTYVGLKEKEERNANRPVWAIGPLCMWSLSETKKSNYRHVCLDWLDKQAQNSVLYVSFGTTVSLTDKQIIEIALGLEQSGQKFVWVLRDADKGNLSEEVKRFGLPNGYEERIKEVGMVLRDWAPQLEILGHPSVGGFMSHCGWNSCLDGIMKGVPIATWPMHSDQPKNAFLVTEILKVGLAVIKWENRNEIVTAEAVAQVVKCLMASKEGEEVRESAMHLHKLTKDAVKEGGVSRIEFDSFVAHITR